MGNAQTNVESIASPVVNKCSFLDQDSPVLSPIVLNGLYDESKCWTDRVHVFVHQPLNNCGFTSIVQASELHLAKLAKYQWQSTTYSIKILISLSFSRALRKIESIVPMITLLQRTEFVTLGYSEDFEEA